jgi:hypothetical protein
VSAAVKHRRVIGAERRNLGKDLATRYGGGEPIRALAASTGWSYGFVHRVLTESGVRLRKRGGGPGMSAASVEQLVATLAARHPGERLSGRKAAATLRAVHDSCSDERARAACKRHNEQVLARVDDRKPRTRRSTR